jgi:predicted nuclease with TOPRIM domain
VLRLTKCWIAERSTEAQHAARVAELEKANAQLHIELDYARSKLAEVEHRERALTSEYEDLEKDFESICTAYDVVVMEKAKVEETERVKLQRFQDSLHKKLAELRHDTEASAATLGGRSVEFPTGTSLSDFLE